MKTSQQVYAERAKVEARLANEPYLTKAQLRGIEAIRLFESGFTNADIGRVLGVTERQVRKIRADAEARSTDGPDPIDGKDHPWTAPWRRWEAHYLECEEAWDDAFHGTCSHGVDIQAAVDAAVEGFVLFYDALNREGHTFAGHAKGWLWAAFRHIRLLLNVPPRHAKSMYLSEWLPIFLVAADRAAQVLIISQTEDFAKKFCRYIAAEMTVNQRLIHEFGRFVPTDSKVTWSPSQGELKVEGWGLGDRSIQVRGSRQQVLGMEATWITCDDPDDPEKARSELERRRLQNWYKEQVLSRGAPGCHVTVIGQRVGVNDLYGWLASKRSPIMEGEPPVYKHILTPAVLDWEAEEVLWPDVWSFNRLMKERYTDDPGTFETMYQQNPQTEGMAIFDSAWIHGHGDFPGCLDLDRDAGEPMVSENRADLPVVRVVSVDPSPTQYSAFIVADIVHNYQEFHCAIMHIESEKIHGRDILNHLDHLVANYDADYLIIEDSAVSKWIFQDPWFEQMKMRTIVRSHNTNAKTKGDPEWGVQSLATDFSAGRIRFPYGDAEGRAMSAKLLEEMYAYDPLDKSRNDCIMALWFIRFAHRALVPNLRLVGGFEGTGRGKRVSPVVKRAMARKDTEDERIRKWREREHSFSIGSMTDG